MVDKIKITAEASQAISTIEKVKGSLDKITTAATSLQSRLSGLFLGATILNAIRLADSVSDLSKATDIAVESILGFNAAVVANGGTIEGAEKGIQKLVQTIGDAAGGSLQAQNAFARIGISLTDLRNLSEQDLLKLTIQKLGEITDKSKQAAAANDIYGKSLKGTDWNGLASDIERATAAQKKNAEATKAAGQLQDNLDTALRKLNESILRSIKPLADFVNSLKPEQVDKFVNALVQIAGAAGALVLVGNVLSLVGGAFATLFAVSSKGIGFLKSGLAMLSAAFLAFAKPIGDAAGWLTRFALAIAGIGGEIRITATGVSLLGRFLLAIIAPLGLIAAGFSTIAAVVVGVTTALWLAFKASDAFFDTKIIDTFTSYAIRARDAIRDIGVYLGVVNKEAPKEVVPNQGRGKQGGPTAEELAAYEKLQKAKKEADKPVGREVIDALAKRRLEIQQTAEAFKDYIDTQNTGRFQEASFVGMQEDQVELFKAQIEVLNKAEEEIKKLQVAKSLLSKDEQGLASVYDSQIKKIRELTLVGLDETAQAVTNNQTVKALETDRLQRQQNMVKAIEDQIARQQTLGETLQKINDQRKDVEFQGSTVGMGEMEKQIANIQENARKAALEAGRAYAQAFEDTGDGMTPEKAQEFADGLAKITEGYKAIAESQIANVEASRTWEAGWKEAFANYVDDATNAATMAKDVFSSMTSNMNSALDKFVETGKLNFGDLARSIILDLLKIQLKKAAAGFVGSLFGFANGGSPPVGRPSIVGERGPELFVPNVAGKIIPNNQLGSLGGGGGVVNHYTYNNNVTAMDAKSVAQLFYDNRHTMFGTVEAAKKEMPMRR